MSPTWLNRRSFLRTSVAALILVPTSAVRGQGKQGPPVIGWLSVGTRETHGVPLREFKAGLADFGRKEGVHYRVEERWADGRAERFQSMAEEIATTNPAIIVAAPTNLVAIAAKVAPKTPVVQASGGDLVVAALATSLARPGGMVTGVANLVADVTEKHIELLLAAVPSLRRIGCLGDAATTSRLGDVIRRTASHHRVNVVFADARNGVEIEAAILRLVKDGAQALTVMASAVFTTERSRIVRLASTHRLPAIAHGSPYAEAGLLMSYASDFLANYRRAAYYVDRILKGAKPGDLPIEQSTRLELVINRAAAKSLGITLPQELLLRADKVIE